jgi:hypothetical protein
MSHNWQAIALTGAVVLLASAIYELHKESQKGAGHSESADLMVMARIVLTEIGVWRNTIRAVVSGAKWTQYLPGIQAFEDHQAVIATDGPIFKAAQDAFYMFVDARNRYRPDEGLSSDDFLAVTHDADVIEKARTFGSMTSSKAERTRRTSALIPCPFTFE